jgi:hypothetical protein
MNSILSSRRVQGRRRGQTWCVTKDAQDDITYSGPVGPPPPAGYDPTGYNRVFRDAQRPGLYCTPIGDLGAMDCR